MHYVVLIYPNISEHDYKMIQGIRKTSDKQFSIVKPHFTLIFPTDKVSSSEILQHIKTVKLSTQPFNFTLTKAVVEENIYPTYFQIQLVANQPIAEIIEIHDSLYVDILANELREDIPYVPHITVASNKSRELMQQLADKINKSGIAIEGRVDKITMSSFDGTAVVDIEERLLLNLL